jgi:PAS domain S-box-containing protein
MGDQDKIIEQLTGELARLRQQLAEHKRAAEALRQNERRLHSVIEQARDGIALVDEQGIVVQWNRAMEQCTGLQAEEALGRPIWDVQLLLTPEEQRAPALGEYLRAGLLQFLQTGQAVWADRTLEREHVLPDGSKRIVQGTVFAIETDRGFMLINVTRDVTERRQAEQALRQYAEQLEALRQVGLEITAELDVDALLHSIVSRAIELLRGRSGGIYLYRAEQDVLEWMVGLGPDLAPVGTVLRRGEGLSGQVLESGEAMIVDDYQRWEGRAPAYAEAGYPWTAVVAVPVRWGEEFLGVLNVLADPPRTFSAADVELLGMFATQAAIAMRNAQLYDAAQRELAERKRAEEALRESEARYRLLAENVSDVIWTTDLDMRLTYVSPSAERLRGYTVEETMNQKISEMVTPASLRIIEKELKALMAAGESERGGPPGTETLELEFTRKDGTTVWAESAISFPCDAQGQPQAILGVTRDISERRQAEEQLRASLREKEILLREIHHRVKNNLQVVSSLLDLQSQVIDDPRVQRAFRNSQHRIRSMALVHEKLYQSPDLTRINIAEYVSSLLNYLHGVYGGWASGVSMDVQVDDVDLSLDTAIGCGLIINELVSNGLKHAFPDRDGDGDREIHVGLREEAGEITLVVGDNGVGLPRDLDWRQPTSLGLHLVGMLTQQLQGNIELESGAGTRFRITFTGTKPAE